MNSDNDIVPKRPASVRLHIEHLVLDGFPLQAGDAHKMGLGLEAELSRLIAQGGLGALTETSLSSAAGCAIQVPHLQMRPIRLGQQIAQSVYGTLRESPTDHNPGERLK